jgi:ABC-2 type transport system permease protein
MRTIRSEWTKLRTLPSTLWLLLLAAAGTVALGYAITGTLEYRGCEAPCTLDTTKLALSGVRLGQIGVVIVAALAVTAEYSTRTIVPSLAATPGRLRLLASKLVVVTAVTVVAGGLAVLVSLAVARGVLPGNGFTPEHGYAMLTLADSLTRRAAVGTVLYLGLVATLSTGVGAIVRDTAGAVATILALLYGGPMMALVLSNPRWQDRIHRWAPMDAGLAIQSTRDVAANQIGPWAGLGVLSAYAAVAVLLGTLVFRLRDA